MEDYSIIPGQALLEVMFALLLTIVTVLVYVSCRVYARPGNVHVASLKTIRATGTHKDRESSSASAGCSALKKHQPWASDWLAPLIVWSAVVWTTLAVISILLGDN